MTERETIYDPAVADGRFQLEVLAVRWGLVALYALFALTDVIDVTTAWFVASEGFLIAFHIYYTWYVWRELGPRPLPFATMYATPFLDTVAITIALIAVGDPMHPIWGVYFFVVVSVAFFYYPVTRLYGFWLLANYAFVGIGLQARGLDVPVPLMGVAATLLLAGVLNVATYTGSERRLRQRISDVADTDPLTGLLNRRGLEETLGRQLTTGVLGSKGFAVLMVDVDRFKRYNDQFGHLNADGVLEQLALVLSAAVRESDCVARYGGDEFVVILSDVTPEEGVRLAERLCEQVARLGLCTISIGVSVSHGGGAKVDEVLGFADTALLAAKQAGRNCVRTWGVDLDLAA